VPHLFTGIVPVQGLLPGMGCCCCCCCCCCYDISIISSLSHTRMYSLCGIIQSGAKAPWLCVV